jgi:hypothetical protein
LRKSTMLKYESCRERNGGSYIRVREYHEHTLHKKAMLKITRKPRRGADLNNCRIPPALNMQATVTIPVMRARQPK